MASEIVSQLLHPGTEALLRDEHVFAVREESNLYCGRRDIYQGNTRHRRLPRESVFYGSVGKDGLTMKSTLDVSCDGKCTVGDQVVRLFLQVLTLHRQIWHHAKVALNCVVDPGFLCATTAVW